MHHTKLIIQKGQDLQILLEKIQSGFSYQLLSLQIELEMDFEPNEPKINKITRLIQLYMTAVEVLESKSDKRYKYFNNKIQNLMKKKHIVEQLHKASTGRAADQAAMAQVMKAQIGQRKNDLDFQILLNTEQIHAKEIKQMMQTTDNKLKVFEKNIEKNIQKQDDKLEERRRLRKMRSDAGSVSKINLDNYFTSPVKKKSKDFGNYFDTDNMPIKKRGGSNEKQVQKSKATNLLKGIIA